jgi:hypothetical protein
MNLLRSRRVRKVKAAALLLRRRAHTSGRPRSGPPSGASVPLDASWPPSDA